MLGHGRLHAVEDAIQPFLQEAPIRHITVAVAILSSSRRRRSLFPEGHVLVPIPVLVPVVPAALFVALRRVPNDYYRCCCSVLPVDSPSRVLVCSYQTLKVWGISRRAEDWLPCAAGQVLFQSTKAQDSEGFIPPAKETDSLPTCMVTKKDALS